MRSESTFSRNKSMVSGDDDRLNETVEFDGRCEIVNVTEVISDAITSRDTVNGDFKRWEGFEDGRYAWHQG